MPRIRFSFNLNWQDLLRNIFGLKVASVQRFVVSDCGAPSAQGRSLRDRLLDNGGAYGAVGLFSRTFIGVESLVGPL
jgi:hypothetical protein